MSKLVVNWTLPALRDMREAWEYISVDNEIAADKIIDRIEAAADRLTKFPKLGRPGKLKGTREWTVTGTSYRIVYEATRRAIEVRRVIHGSMDWPPGMRKRP